MVFANFFMHPSVSEVWRIPIPIEGCACSLDSKLSAMTNTLRFNGWTPQLCRKCRVTVAMLVEQGKARVPGRVLHRRQSNKALGEKIGALLSLGHSNRDLPSTRVLMLTHKVYMWFGISHLSFYFMVMIFHFFANLGVILVGQGWKALIYVYTWWKKACTAGYYAKPWKDGNVIIHSAGRAAIIAFQSEWSLPELGESIYVKYNDWACLDSMVEGFLIFSLSLSLQPRISMRPCRVMLTRRRALF